jgi:hypothetical protein
MATTSSMGQERRSRVTTAIRPSPITIRASAPKELKMKTRKTTTATAGRLGSGITGSRLPRFLLASNRTPASAPLAIHMAAISPCFMNTTGRQLLPRRDWPNCAGCQPYTCLCRRGLITISYRQNGT